MIASPCFPARRPRRHRNSQQGESKQLLAVLGAVLEVVRAQGLEPTPTAIFAATMMSFEAPEVSFRRRAPPRASRGPPPH